MKINWIQTIIEILIISIGLIILYWKSYLSESGKNRATKKDIENITEKIETIKNDISLSSQRKLDYIKDKKEAALNFLDTVSVWIDLYLRPLDYIYNNPANSVILKQLISDLKKQGALATNAYWRLYIYFENKAIIDTAEKLYNRSLDIHNITNQLLIKLERIAIKLDNINEIYYKVTDKAELKEMIEEEKKQIDIVVKDYITEKEKIENEVTNDRMGYIVAISLFLKIK